MAYISCTMAYTTEQLDWGIIKKKMNNIKKVTAQSAPRKTKRRTKEPAAPATPNTQDNPSEKDIHEEGTRAHRTTHPKKYAR